jgi:diguanylate cyclase (GGDEF)-like protein
MNGELIGTNSADYIHPEDREMARVQAIEALKGHSTLPYEFRTIRKDLETVWVSERVTSIEYGGDHAIVGALMDITERKIAEAESQAHTRQVETLFSISAAVSQTLNLTELLDTILKKVLAVMETGAGGIFLIDGQSNELVLKAHQGCSAEFAKKVTRMKIGRGFAGRVALSGKPVIIGRTLTDARFDPVVLEQEGLHSLTSVPIMAKDNIMGVMCVGSYNHRDFIERDVRLLVTIANQIGMAIDNAQLYEKTVEISFVDELTGLYNRRYLMEQIERDFTRASRQRSPLSLMMIDMDGLKAINDRYGHNEGSGFLKQLGKIIKTNTRASDVAARLGGDEFVLLAPETDVEEAREVGERLLSETRQYRKQIEGWEVGLSISIGIATYPTHASDVEDILKKADEALYEAKRAGKNRLCLAVSEQKLISLCQLDPYSNSIQRLSLPLRRINRTKSRRNLYSICMSLYLSMYNSAHRDKRKGIRDS